MIRPVSLIFFKCFPLKGLLFNSGYPINKPSASDQRIGCLMPQASQGHFASNRAAHLEVGRFQLMPNALDLLCQGGQS